VSYYEKNPEQLKTDFNEKRVVYRNGKFFVQPQVRQLVEEYQKELQKQYDTNAKNSKKYRKNVEDSITKTVQEVVNNGDLQSGYYMYLSLKDHIKFPDHMVETWAQAYIGNFVYPLIKLEILRIYRFYHESNEIISTCPIQRIHQGNTVN
jgi:ribosomal protein S17E